MASVGRPFVSSLQSAYVRVPCFLNEELCVVFGDNHEQLEGEQLEATSAKTCLRVCTSTEEAVETAGSMWYAGLAL